MGSVLALLAVEGAEGIALLAGEGAAAVAAAEGSAIAMDSMILLEGFSAAEAAGILGVEGVGEELAAAGTLSTGSRLGALGAGSALSAGVAAALGFFIEGAQGANIEHVGGNGRADFGNMTVPSYTETFLSADMWAVLGELKYQLFEALAMSPEDAVIAESESTRLGRDAQGVPHLIFLDKENQIQGAFDQQKQRFLTPNQAKFRGVSANQGPVNSARRPQTALPELPPPETTFRLPEDPTEEEVEDVVRQHYSDANYHFMTEQYGYPLPGLSGPETLFLSVADLITAHSSRSRRRDRTSAGTRRNRKRKRDE